MYKVCFTCNKCQYDLDKHFHDSDKMPKHFEMVRTKCQPKSWDGQNANQRDKSGQNTNLWLALCPVGILPAHRIFHLPVYQPTQDNVKGQNLIDNRHSKG